MSGCGERQQAIKPVTLGEGRLAGVGAVRKQIVNERIRENQIPLWRFGHTLPSLALDPSSVALPSPMLPSPFTVVPAPKIKY